MGGNFVDSLQHILLQTGYEDVSSIDFNYYIREDKGMKAVFEFLTTQITDDNCLRIDHLEVVETLKSQNAFLNDALVKKELKCAYQLNAHPPITEVDIDCCKIELFELQKQLDTLETLKDYLIKESEELHKNCEETKINQSKCDGVMSRVVDQCANLYVRYDCGFETAHNTFMLFKNNLKDIASNKKLKKEFLFQFTDHTGYRINSRLYKKMLLKLVRKIGQPQLPAADVNSSLVDLNFSVISNDNNKFSIEAFNKIFNSEVPSTEEFEQNKTKWQKLCVSLHKTCYRKVMKSIEKNSVSAVLETLKKMSNDVEGGALQMAMLKEDMQDAAYNSNDSSSSENNDMVDIACGEWMKLHVLRNLTNRLEKRAVRREKLFEQLNSICSLIQSRMVMDDMLWMIMVSEKNLISSLIDYYRSTVTESSGELSNFQKRMIVMEKNLERNPSIQTLPEENIACIQKMLMIENNDSSNQISDAIDECFESFDRIGSKFINHASKLSEILDKKSKEIDAYNRILFEEPGDLEINDYVLDDIKNRISQINDSIDTESALIEEKKKYFQNQPYEKDYALAWAIFLTNKEKLKKSVENLEKEARLIQGNKK